MFAVKSILKVEGNVILSICWQIWQIQKYNDKFWFIIAGNKMRWVYAASETFGRIWGMCNGQWLFICSEGKPHTHIYIYIYFDKCFIKYYMMILIGNSSLFSILYILWIYRIISNIPTNKQTDHSNTQWQQKQQPIPLLLKHLLSMQSEIKNNAIVQRKMKRRKNHRSRYTLFSKARILDV